MAVISLGSTDAFAATETSRFIGPLLHWLFPDATPATLEVLHGAIRKLGHVAEFAVLALLWYRALAWAERGWKPRATLAAFGLALLFAVLDEAHQAFEPSRDGSPIDVGWDSLGALCGLVGRSLLFDRVRRAEKTDAPKKDSSGRLKIPFGD
jgi:VanZ family protein